MSADPHAPSVCPWSQSPTKTSSRPRRRCCTTTSTVGCGRRPSSSWPPRSGTQLPSTDPDALGSWFVDGGRLRLAGALPGDVRAHRRGDADRPRRCTGSPRECALDLAADGVVYAEVRFAPEQHLERGLTLDEVVEAVLAGFADGAAEAAAAGPADPGRHAADRDAARRPVAGDRRAGGAVPRHRRGRLRHRRRRGGLPAHPAPGRVRVPAAGELPLHHPRRRGVRAAVDLAGDPVVRRGPARATGCGSSTTSPPGARPVLGRLAAYVRDKRIPLELCPSSNVQTGAAPSIAEHPIGLLRDLRFRVTVNTDNRLMSGTSMSREMALLVGGVRLGLGRAAVVHHQRDEERVHPVRRAAGDHQRGDQAGVRQAADLTRVGATPNGGTDRQLTEPADAGPSARTTAAPRPPRERPSPDAAAPPPARRAATPGRGARGRRWLAALGEVADQPADEGHAARPPQRVRAGQQPATAFRDDLGREYPFGHEKWRSGEIERPGGYPAVGTDRVNRHFGPPSPASRAIVSTAARHPTTVATPNLPAGPRGSVGSSPSL